MEPLVVNQCLFRKAIPIPGMAFLRNYVSRNITGIDIFMRPTFPTTSYPSLCDWKINRIITNNLFCVWKHLDSDCAICFDSFQEKDLVMNTF